jgi:hypothetical protein
MDMIVSMLQILITIWEQFIKLLENIRFLEVTIDTLKRSIGN